MIEAGKTDPTLSLEGRGGRRLYRPVSIDMSPAYTKAVTENFPNAQITFDKFHVIAHASPAIDQTRRHEQKRDPGLKWIRWVLLKDRDRLNTGQRADGAVVDLCAW